MNELNRQLITLKQGRMALSIVAGLLVIGSISLPIIFL